MLTLPDKVSEDFTQRTRCLFKKKKKLNKYYFNEDTQQIQTLFGGWTGIWKMLTFLVFDAKDSLPLQFWGRTWRDRGSKEYPFGDTHVKQFPNIPLRKMPQPRLSTGLAMLLTECFSFHLAMNWKRRVQDTEWLRFHFWDVTTKNHSWAQKIWRWKNTMPVLFHLFPNV